MTFAQILGVFVMLASIVGYIANIIQIIMVFKEPVTGIFVVKCFGVLVLPLGSIMGIFGMF